MNHENIDRYVGQPLLISEEGSKFLQLLPQAKINREPHSFLLSAMLEQEVKALEMLSFGPSDGRRPYPLTDGGIALIGVSGALEANSMWYGSYWTGYEAIESRMRIAMEDPAVKGVALIVNSSGGEAAGCFECSEMISSFRGSKPIRALVKHRAFSAAYAIASAADSISGTPSAEVGSIGVVMAHTDISKALESAGVDITLIFAGKHKTDGNPYEPLPKSVREDFQERIDRAYGSFVETVAKNRNINTSMVKDTEARCYGIADAISAGLADSIETEDQFFNRFHGDLKSKSTGRLGQMTETVETPQQAEVIDVNQVAASAAAAERQRISEILSCEAAEGREGLAQHFAMNTSMEPAEAIAALEASPKERQEAQEPANPLASAMQDEPDVDIDAGTGEDNTSLTAAQQLFANFKNRKAR